MTHDELLEGQREITLIGGSRHGEKYVINDSAPIVVKGVLIPLSNDSKETYTICQLKSGQWIGYIAIEKELK